MQLDDKETLPSKKSLREETTCAQQTKGVKKGELMANKQFLFFFFLPHMELNGQIIFLKVGG